jgi:ComF family protein
MFLKQHIERLIDHFIFAAVCPGCGEALPKKESPMVCLHCQQELPATGFFSINENALEKKFWGRVPLQAVGCLYYFTKESIIQRIMHLLKYQNQPNLGVQLGTLMGKQMQASRRFANIDGIVPLPLNEKRQFKRGYNQAAMIANGIAEVLQIPVLSNIIVRGNYTSTQTQKSKAERWQNMQGVFQLASTQSAQNKHLLLVDDIVTTGSTLEACSRELLKIDGLSLSIATAAYTYD